MQILNINMIVLTLHLCRGLLDQVHQELQAMNLKRSRSHRTQQEAQPAHRDQQQMMEVAADAAGFPAEEFNIRMK